MGPTCCKILHIIVVVNGYYVSVIIDTGAELNIISHHLTKGVCQRSQYSNLPLTAGGQRITSQEETWASLELRGNKVRKLKVKATVLAGPPKPLILGMEYGGFYIMFNKKHAHPGKKHDMVIPMGPNIKNTHQLHPIANTKSTHKLNPETNQKGNTRNWKEVFREIPGLIFSLPSNIAWTFTASTTPSKDREFGEAIRNYLAEKKHAKLTLYDQLPKRKQTYYAVRY